MVIIGMHEIGIEIIILHPLLRFEGEAWPLWVLEGRSTDIIEAENENEIEKWRKINERRWKIDWDLWKKCDFVVAMVVIKPRVDDTMWKLN